MERTPTLTALATATAATLVAAAAWATTVTLAGIPELAEAAPLIIEGRVSQAHVVESNTAPGLFTDYRVEVGQVWRGAPAEVVTVRVPGGQLGQRRVHIEAMPTLKPGSPVLLMLEPLPEGAFPGKGPLYLPMGLGQGHFVLDAQAGVFRRPDMPGNIDARPWCTGGEGLDTFEVGAMRKWLGERFGQGDRR